MVFSTWNEIIIIILFKNKHQSLCINPTLCAQSLLLFIILINIFHTYEHARLGSGTYSIYSYMKYSTEIDILE